MARIKKTMDTEGHTKADKQRAANDRVAAWLGTQGTTKAAQTSTTPRSVPKGSKTTSGSSKSKFAKAAVALKAMMKLGRPATSSRQSTLNSKTNARGRSMSTGSHNSATPNQRKPSVFKTISRQPSHSSVSSNTSRKSTPGRGGSTVSGSSKSKFTKAAVTLKAMMKLGRPATPSRQSTLNSKTNARGRSMSTGSHNAATPNQRKTSVFKTISRQSSSSSIGSSALRKSTPARGGNGTFAAKALAAMKAVIKPARSSSTPTPRQMKSVTPQTNRASPQKAASKAATPAPPASNSKVKKTRT